MGLRGTRLFIVVLTGMAWLMLLAGCSEAPARRMLPRFMQGPSDERPPWLRDPPQPVERLPAPEGWGGDHLAGPSTGPAAG